MWRNYTLAQMMDAIFLKKCQMDFSKINTMKVLDEDPYFYFLPSI